MLGIADTDPAAQNSERVTAFLQRGSLGDAVHPGSHTAYDAAAGFGKLTRDLLGLSSAVGRTGAGAYHGDRSKTGIGEFSFEKDRIRRIVSLPYS